MIEQTAEAMVKAVDLPGRPWQSNDGQISLTFYQTTFDLNGSEVKAEWAKKGDAPTVGESLTAEFFEKNGKQRVKAASQSGGGGGGGYSGGGGKSPDQQRSIVRQHSQEMALRYAAVLGHNDVALSELKETIDWFEADANQAAKGAGDAAGTPAPAQNGGGDGVHQRIAALLEEAGVNPAAAAVIGDCVVDPEHGFTPAEQDAALETLQKENLRASAVKRLEARALEMRGGEPLPTGSPDDDLIF